MRILLFKLFIKIKTKFLLFNLNALDFILKLFDEKLKQIYTTIVTSELCYLKCFPNSFITLNIKGSIFFYLFLSFSIYTIYTI